MSQELRKQIYNSLNLKETDELIKIWQANDHTEWTEIAFDVIREILQERLVELPPQKKLTLDVHQAIEFYQNALLIARESGNLAKEASALANLGAIYLTNRQVERAIDYYEQALALYSQAGNRKEEITILINLGTSHILLGQLVRALDYNNQALAICRETGDRSNEGMILKIIGQVHFSLNEVETAIEKTQSAVKIFDEIGDPGAGNAREQLNRLSTEKSKKNPLLIVVPIGLILILIFAIYSGLTKNRSSSRAQTSTEQKGYVSIAELYRNTPANSTEQKNWDQWKYTYEGKYVKGNGKLVEANCFPQEGKIILIINLNGEEGTIENNPTQIALLIDDAHTMSFGEEEGSFLIDSMYWIYLGEDYTFEGRVSGFSLFDPEVVYLGHRDLIILQVKMKDLWK